MFLCRLTHIIQHWHPMNNNWKEYRICSKFSSWFVPPFVTGYSDYWSPREGSSEFWGFCISLYLLRWISLLMKNKLTLRGRVVALMKTSYWEPAVKKTRKLQDVLTAVSNQVCSLSLSYSFSFLHSRKEVSKRVFRNLSLVYNCWQLGKSMIFVKYNQVLQTTSRGQVVLGHK